MITSGGVGCACAPGLGSQHVEPAGVQTNLETIGQVYRYAAIALGLFLGYHLYKAGTR